MPVTIKDVAAEAGVSITAVSKVLHGRGANIRVGQATAESIRAAAAKLRYFPNALAQGLRTSRTHNVGLIFENFGEISAGPMYYVHLLDGVAQELFSRHYQLTILPEIDNSNIAATLGDGRLEGVIWCKLPGDDLALKQVHDSPIPLVALSAPPPLNPHETVFVSCDNNGGTYIAVKHLVDLGHRRIAFVLEQGEENTPDALARADGFLAAGAALGLPVSPNDIVCWKREADEFQDWWINNPKYTAIFAWNERVAAEILKQAEAADIHTPDELSVIGYDSTAFCDTTTPRLTAVRQPIKEMARHATRILLDMIDGRPPELFAYTFPCSLDVRDSTAPPRPSWAGNSLPQS